ncbi:TIGR03557 family F420-dependent LLM class oxidoreductase [Bailinhaonella thermotolerans]|uniref:TIGR03557 family F420-dependent LLM class oxidoreductase n=1 Tax=Bailinhaonella thermotolerans TaxID=1070861 RepID=A0A3A4AZH1_9ACTN|nr:TIGR03557 family F420-dependent LLM class oxidoreductase [Bailinhaonella thermotolerans]RJL24772.1 TIGR03557 family F420-dependent LLM class oxidoreductase [Bailinhaonella thermotolerans]
MTQFGFTALCEQTPPKQLVSDLVGAEAAGFDFSVISDHYFPWLEEQGHAAYAWSVLGAAAHATERLPLMTFVTCPTFRYHPAVVAQKAATVGVLSDGRFTLGLGSGENLNEHIIGRGWPTARVRHKMLREAIEIIRALFSGDYVDYEGEFFDVDSARIYDRPDTPVPIAVAASGAESGAIAADLGDALIATEPKAEIVRAFEYDGGTPKPKYGQIPVYYDTDARRAEEHAGRLWRFGVAGWKVMSELPAPVNFAAHSSFVRPGDVAKSVPCGPELEVYLDAVRKYVEAGFTHIALCQIGADRQADFLDWARRELLPALRSL